MVGEWITPVVVAALITGLASVVAAVATQFLAAFVPRLWQEDQRRLQAESETRIKRIEAFERALSLASKAKEEFGIEIPTYELLNQIVHEFAGPVVLSREALEEWESRPFRKRLSNFPEFTFPPREAKDLRSARRFRFVSGIFLMLYYPILVGIIEYIIGPERLVNMFNSGEWLVVFFFGFYIPGLVALLWLATIVGTPKALRRALRTIRAMPESGATGKTGPVIMQPLPKPGAERGKSHSGYVPRTVGARPSPGVTGSGASPDQPPS